MKKITITVVAFVEGSYVAYLNGDEGIFDTATTPEGAVIKLMENLKNDYGINLKDLLNADV